MKPPVRTKYVAPVYPSIAQSSRTQGVVIIEATIGIDGTVRDAKILRSIPLLDAAGKLVTVGHDLMPTTKAGLLDRSLTMAP